MSFNKPGMVQVLRSLGKREMLFIVSWEMPKQSQIGTCRTVLRRCSRKTGKNQEGSGRKMLPFSRRTQMEPRAILTRLSLLATLLISFECLTLIKSLLVTGHHHILDIKGPRTTIFNVPSQKHTAKGLLPMSFRRMPCSKKQAQRQSRKQRKQ